MTPRLLTWSEAAAVARLHPGTIRLFVKTGKLRVYPTWRGARIDREELLRVVEEYRRARAAQDGAR